MLADQFLVETWDLEYPLELSLFHPDSYFLRVG